MTVIKGKFNDDVTPEEILEGVNEYNLKSVFVIGSTDEGEMVLAYSTQDEQKLLGQIDIAHMSIAGGFFR